MKSVVVDKVSAIRTTIPGVLQYPIGGKGLTFGESMVAVVYANGLMAKAKAALSLVRAAL